MSTMINTHKFTAAAALGAAAMLSMLSFGGSAEAAQSLSSCKGATASKVISCCEKMVKENGRPTWMIETKTSCHQAAVCKGGSGPSPLALVVVAKRCYLRTVVLMDESHGKNGNDGGRGRQLR